MVFLFDMLAGCYALVVIDLVGFFLLQQCGGGGVIDATSTLKRASGVIGFRRMDRSTRVKGVPAFLIWAFSFKASGRLLIRKLD